MIVTTYEHIYCVNPTRTKGGHFKCVKCAAITK